MKEMATSIEIMKSVELELAEITEAQIDRAGRELGKPKKGETSIYTLPKESMCRRLYALGMRYAAKADTMMAQSKIAEDAEKERELYADSHRFRMLAKLCKEIFWCEVHGEAGSWQENIGVRKDWVIVKIDDVQANGIAGLLGRLGLPGGEDDD